MSKLILILFFVLLVIIVVRMQGKQAGDFIAQADKISGVIIKKEEQARRNDQPTRKEYLVSYSYRVNGSEYIGRENVEYSDLWQGMEEGQNVDIYYLRSDPANSHLAMLLDRRAKTAN
jgi:hypothetical protein